MYLNDIIEKIYKEKSFTSLEVTYRTFDRDSRDLFFGSCIVHKKMSGYSVESLDGDDYNLSDEIEQYEYDCGKLTVWVKCVWTNSEGIIINRD